MTKRRLSQHNAIGPLSAKSLQLPHYVPPKQEWAPSSRVTNAGSTGSYSQAHEWRNSGLRPGCMDFLKHPSKGVG